MAEENINEVLGIEDNNQQSQSSGIFDKEPNENNEPASKGLQVAADICSFLLWLCVILVFIGGIMYLYNVGNLDSYSDYKKADAILYTGIGASLFSYGFIGMFSCFIIKKVLIGLAVITEAAEKYLTK